MICVILHCSLLNYFYKKEYPSVQDVFTFEGLEYVIKRIHYIKPYRLKPKNAVPHEFTRFKTLTSRLL